jgi:uncharacterized protein (DUF58 family)
MWRLAWRAYRSVSGLQFWILRRFTPAGLLVLGVAILAAVFGVNTNQNVAYRVFTFLFALIALSLVAARLMRGSFEVTRHLPRAVAIGDEFEYRLIVRNLGKRKIDGITVLEDLADPRPGFAEFRARLKTPTFANWKDLVERKRVARVVVAPVPVLDAYWKTNEKTNGNPHGETELRVRGHAYRRGRVHFTGCSVALSDPFGLFRKIVTLAEEANLLVLPRRYRLPPLPLPGSRMYQQGGVTLASAVGDSEEFIGLREYRPGDPLQKIHWKSFARLGEPVVREYQDEFFERHALILDTFAAAAEERSFEEAVAIAASFAYTIDTQDCLLDLMFVGAETYTYTAGRGQLQTATLLEVLAGVQPCGDKPFRVLHDAALAKRGALSGCICILVRWDAERRAFIDALHASGVATRVLVVSEREIPDRPPWLTVLEPGKIQEGLASL